MHQGNWKAISHARICVLHCASSIAYHTLSTNRSRLPQFISPSVEGNIGKVMCLIFIIFCVYVHACICKCVHIYARTHASGQPWALVFTFHLVWGRVYCFLFLYAKLAGLQALRYSPVSAFHLAVECWGYRCVYYFQIRTQIFTMQQVLLYIEPCRSHPQHSAKPQFIYNHKWHQL